MSFSSHFSIRYSFWCSHNLGFFGGRGQLLRLWHYLPNSIPRNLPVALPFPIRLAVLLDSLKSSSYHPLKHSHQMDMLFIDAKLIPRKEAIQYLRPTMTALSVLCGGSLLPFPLRCWPWPNFAVASLRSLNL